MAINPADADGSIATFGTWTRQHPTTGATQTLVAESAEEAVRYRFNGWTRLDADQSAVIAASHEPSPLYTGRKSAAAPQPAARPSTPRRTTQPASEPEAKPEP